MSSIAESPRDTAFELAVSNIRFGRGVTREVGMDLAEMGLKRVMVVTDPVVAKLALAAAIGRRDPTGQDRRQKRDRGQALAGKSRLNRLELSPPGASADSRYKKIAARHSQVEDYFVGAAMMLEPQPPEEVMLDLDATDNPLHGHQLGRFFHGYYQGYCYLPLYIF